MTISCRTETVKLSDGTTFVVAEENWLTGVTLLRLQKAAADAALPGTTIERQYFSLVTYPKLAAAVIEGTPPPENEALLMPTSEMAKWYDAVVRLNPQWFPENKPEEDPSSTEKKRKPRKRR